MNFDLDYLVLPMQPTPNGRLHIGHGAGPYLNADVLTRSLRRKGCRVMQICGADSYENWVVLEARRRNVDPVQLARTNYLGISRDLANLGVELDVWIDPLDAEHRDQYARSHEALVEELIRSHSASELDEQIPVSAISGEAVIGVWIEGLCPTCRAPVAGNSCVKCGAGFQPSEIVAPHSRLDGGALRWTSRKSWFAQEVAADTLLSYLEHAGVPPHFRQIAKVHADRAGTRVRISQPGEWGIASDIVGSGNVLSNTFYGYCVYCANVAAKISGSGLHPLATDSATEVVALFGKDNAGIGLISPFVIANNSNSYRCFDYIIVNHLLHLEGRKCSTSQGHGIWISELVENTSVSSDQLRYYLSQLDLGSDTQNVAVDELLASINELRAWEQNTLRVATDFAEPEQDATVLSRAFKALAAQERALAPGNFSLCRAASFMRNWMFASDLDLTDPPVASAWLVGVSLLCAPILPQISQKVWLFLGASGIPKSTYLAEIINPGNWPGTDHSPLTVGEVAPFLRLAEVPTT